MALNIKNAEVERLAAIAPLGVLLKPGIPRQCIAPQDKGFDSDVKCCPWAGVVEHKRLKRQVWFSVVAAFDAFRRECESGLYAQPHLLDTRSHDPPGNHGVHRNEDQGAKLDQRKVLSPAYSDPVALAQGAAARDGMKT